MLRFAQGDTAACSATVSNMDSVVDLDAAAAEIRRRIPQWTARGLEPGAITWRDAAAPWPQQPQTDRTSVVDPDSVGLRFSAADAGVAEIVLYRGGWADLTVIPNTRDREPIISTAEISTPDAFGALLDAAIGTLLTSRIPDQRGRVARRAERQPDEGAGGGRSGGGVAGLSTEGDRDLHGCRWSRKLADGASPDAKSSN